jgi:hypothetical protein
VRPRRFRQCSIAPLSRPPRLSRRLNDHRLRI